MPVRFDDIEVCIRRQGWPRFVTWLRGFLYRWWYGSWIVLGTLSFIAPFTEGPTEDDPLGSAGELAPLILLCVGAIVFTETLFRRGQFRLWPAVFCRCAHPWKHLLINSPRERKPRERSNNTWGNIASVWDIRRVGLNRASRSRNRKARVARTCLGACLRAVITLDNTGSPSADAAGSEGARPRTTRDLMACQDFSYEPEWVYNGTQHSKRGVCVLPELDCPLDISKLWPYYLERAPQGMNKVWRQAAKRL